MKTIEILGTGCRRCHTLAENAEKAARELGIEFELFRVTELDDILDYGVLMTPALVVDGQIKIEGAVPAVEEIKPLLQ